ncbi:MAG TPA: amidohydrolase [Anaerolineae bacterium]|nr:amidohydrolase [Anaerolineae bacterium]
MQNLIGRVSGIVDRLEERLIAYRRDLHRHPELGWTEFRTASLIARRLAALGYEVAVGRQVVREADRMGVPSEETLEACWERARSEGGDAKYLQAVRGGFTGVVGELRNGRGPVVALRFDIDALGVQEDGDPEHRPAREGFVSIHDGVSHACGHDAHVAAGLGVAEVLQRLRPQIEGRVRLVFQPAEEGVRGARAMVGAGVMDGVDYLVGHHLYSSWRLGEIAGGMGGYLATTKFDACLTGRPAHASGEPHKGRNALLAAATAVLNLYAISRHRQGATRINVGQLVAGTGRNVVPAEAQLMVETRGATTELNDYMFARAKQVLEAAAVMYDCELEITEMGAATGGSSDRALADRIESIARQVGGFTVREPEESGGSEDLTYMMARVQEQGGLATNVGIGADLGGWGHHTERFDIDERALRMAVVLLSLAAVNLAASG